MRGPIAHWAMALCAVVWLSACSSGDGDSPAPPPSGNGAPAFTSGAAASTPENATGTVYRATATDPNGDPISFSIAGGPDAGRFAIDAGTGAVRFSAPADFELPVDANRDNAYALTLRASDGALSATLDVVISVTNVAGVVGARRVASGLTQPLYVTALEDGSGRLIVLEKGGVARLLDPIARTLAATPFLNVTSQITAAGEQGLLGMALAPDFATSGALYVNLSAADGTPQIRRYRTLANDRTQVDAATADVILTLPTTAFTNHKGGWLGFGRDGFLYIGTGDGGGGGDPLGNGQNRNSLYGKMLRIDPRTDGFPTDPNRDYAIPAGNPFAGGGGAPEVYAFGLRNPWRAGFDRDTGNLIIGDVGQGAREEIDLIRPGEGGLNFGWNILEGTSVFTAGGSSAGLAPPVAEYDHGTGPLQGRSVTGGYVYRGPIASLRGQYFFGDFINRRVWSVPASSLVQGATLATTQFTDRTAQLTPDVGAIGMVVSFGEDDLGNLYIVDFDGEVFLVVEVES